jgi:hypothetical protein
LVKTERIIDDSTGLVIRQSNYHYNIFDNEKGYLFKNRTSYIKGYQGIKLSRVISNKTDYANMHILAENLYKDTNMICYKRNKKYYPADIEQIAIILNMTERYTREFIQRIIRLGILAKVTVNTNKTKQIQYHVNPLYFNTSKYLSHMLYMLFRKQLDNHLPIWVIERFNEG